MREKMVGSIMKASRAAAGASGSRLEISIPQMSLYICIVARSQDGHITVTGFWLGPLNHAICGSVNDGRTNQMRLLLSVGSSP